VELCNKEEGQSKDRPAEKGMTTTDANPISCKDSGLPCEVTTVSVNFLPPRRKRTEDALISCIVTATENYAIRPSTAAMYSLNVQ
jgi:hypothetical protein